ncbi:DUF4153 domain-containing protein [Cellulomonas biazotea]|uniref:Uncharacterized protein n=1 Tax=Cellulomonas biazotea TaxID=1709 RepID=A0A402DNZ0_9CELL|nr:DUF4173 domain-containing protein [Cellulomonas biazotea]GCE75828.1 hypothetical protein CBZ_08840 [Cellulomonas biazotea]
MSGPGTPQPPVPPRPVVAPVVVGTPGPYGPLLGPPPPPGRVGRAVADFRAQGAGAAPVRVLAVAAGTGVAVAVMVVGHRPGLGVALAGGVAWAAAAPALVRRRSVVDLSLALLSVALLASAAVRDAAWVVTLCVLAAVGAGTVAVTGARSAAAVLAAPASWAAGVLRSLPWVRHGLGEVVGTRRQQLVVVLRGAAVALLVLLVFGALFASADRVFASLLPRVDLGDLPAQAVVAVVVALAAAASAHLAGAPPTWSSARLGAGRPATLTEWLLPVATLDLLVVAFVGVQVGALAGGHRHVLETAGLSYAQYAREGFAQLVVVTALTLVVVAVAVRRAPREDARDRLVVRVALGVLCVGTLGVVLSALRRLDLYVDAFGLTRLRTTVALAEVVMGLVLVLLLVAGARWRGGWLPRAVVAVVGGAALALVVLDPDALIVRHNTTADLDVPLDVAYLQGLSADAVPAMDAVDEPLRSCLLGGATVDEPEGGFGWNLARQRAWQVEDARHATSWVDAGCADVGR